MVKIEIYAVPVFYLEFDEQQVEALTWLSEHHYDRTCRSQSQSGGFVHGLNVQRGISLEYPDISLSWRLTWHEMDLMSKILEFTMGLTEEQTKCAEALRLSVHRAMSMAAVKRSEWSMEFEG